MMRPILDIQYLVNLLKINKIEDIRELLAAFDQSLSEYLLILPVVTQKRDWFSVKRVAHEANGCASYFAAWRLQEAASHLEQAIHEGKTSDELALLQMSCHLEQAMLQVRASIQDAVCQYAENQNESHILG